jgi:hypothetical protein
MFRCEGGSRGTERTSLVMASLTPCDICGCRIREGASQTVSEVAKTGCGHEFCGACLAQTIFEAGPNRSCPCPTAGCGQRVRSYTLVCAGKVGMDGVPFPAALEGVEVSVECVPVNLQPIPREIEYANLSQVQRQGTLIVTCWVQPKEGLLVTKFGFQVIGPPLPPPPLTVPFSCTPSNDCVLTETNPRLRCTPAASHLRSLVGMFSIVTLLPPHFAGCAGEGSHGEISRGLDANDQASAAGALPPTAGGFFPAARGPQVRECG